MSRICLTKREIRKLLQLLLATFDYLKDLKSENELAEYIQFPKIPPKLSESIVMHLIAENRLLPSNIRDVDFGGSRNDLIATTNSNDEILVEVKSTGKSAFQYLGKKDISTDLLVWVHFGDFFLGNETTIEILIVRDPSRYFDEPVKIRLSKFKEKTEQDLEIFELDIDDF
jgi:hypothetical protein